MHSAAETRKNTIFILVLTSLTALLFSFGEYWDFHDEIIKEALFAFVDVFLLAFIPFLFYRNSFLNELAGKWRNAVLSVLKKPKELFSVFVQYAACLLVSAGCAFVVSRSHHIEFNNMLILIACMTGCAILTCFRHRKTAGEHPEKLYLSMVLIAGFFLSAALPAEVGYTWDDQIHFDRMLSVATLNGPYYEADELVYLSAWNPSGYASETEREERSVLINDSFAAGERTEFYHGDMKHLSNISYLPYCIGMIVARGLHLPYTVCIKVSRFFNTAFFGLLIFLSMKKLKFGKILAAAVGLIPTLLYMASGYSYDPWITGFMVLGFSWFFAALQERDKKLENSEIAVMIGAIFLGSVTKAVYFVLLFPLLFMPKDKFRSAKQRGVYIACVFLAAAALASTFVLPILIGGAGSGDALGGEGVNSAEQMKFILTEPFSYMKILFGFLKNEYLTAWSAGAYTANYAYLGADKKIWYLVPLILLAVALTDKTGLRSHTVPVTLASMFALLSAIVLVATALYMSFTPVRHPTVNGCQPRYLLPLVFPALYINSFDRVNLKMNRNIYNTAVIGILCITAILSVGIMLYGLY